MEGLYEFWFRKPYKSLVEQKVLTQFVRPGDRSVPNPKSVAEGAKVRVRILDSPGPQPTFVAGAHDAIVISARVAKIKELTPDDFKGASPDARSVEGVCYQLGLIYNHEFTPDDIVTAYTICYE